MKNRNKLGLTIAMSLLAVAMYSCNEDGENQNPEEEQKLSFQRPACLVKAEKHMTGIGDELSISDSTVYEHDAQGRVTKIWLYAYADSSYLLEEESNLSYNDQGFVTTQEYEDGRSVKYLYNDLNKLTKTEFYTDAELDSYYEVSHLGNLIKTQYFSSEGGDFTVSFTTEYRYDDGVNLKQIKKYEGTDETVGELETYKITQSTYTNPYAYMSHLAPEYEFLMPKAHAFYEDALGGYKETYAYEDSNADGFAEKLSWEDTGDNKEVIEIFYTCD
ncbi:MAG: hypothetical protein HC842_05625 [Cytophagales bacterium]|nr:hypothetical protein [Cytophagales bacterium]